MQERAFTLRTDRFNSTESKPHERCFGEDFAAWLQHNLTRAEVDVSEPIQEDWGWCLVATEAGRKFTVSVGVMDESIGQVPAEWRVGVSYERPMNGLKGFFLPVPVALLEMVSAKLHSVLANEPSFCQLQPAT
jgi:hypothetical protein